MLTIRRSPASAGFSLIEVLITVFVVAVGLLSVAGLQALSKKSSYDSVQRTIATTLSQDIIERMRANSSQLAAYVAGGTISISSTSPLSVPSPACNSSATCTPAQMVNFDLYQWSQALAGNAEQDAAANNMGGLTAPTGCITAGTTLCMVNVAIAWRGVTALEGSANPNACGSGRIEYDAANEAAGSGALRRVLVVSTYIDMPGC